MQTASQRKKLESHSQERSSVNTQTASQRNIINNHSQERSSVYAQTASQRNIVILGSPERSLPSQIRSEYSLRSNHMGRDVDFAFGARSGWKSSQGGANSEGSEPLCQTEEIGIQPSVAQPSHSKEDESTNLDATVNVVSPNESKDVMSTVQLIDDEIVCASKDVMSTTQSEVCKDASKYGTSTNQSDECVLRTNASKDVMSTVRHKPGPSLSMIIQTECDSTGSVVIGQSSTNQETEEMSCAKPKFSVEDSSGGHITMGGRGIQAQHVRNNSYKGRGEGVTKPAFSHSNSISSRRKVQHNMKSDQYLRGKNEGDNLTPTKRKLVQNWWGGRQR